VESRERWRALQSHLREARAASAEGDAARALAAVREALAIDPEFLAAQTLYSRLVSPVGFESVPAPEPVVTSVSPVPDAVAAGRTRAPDVQTYECLEERVKRRRMERRLEAARDAVAHARFAQAAATVNELNELDPALPELPALRLAIADSRTRRRYAPGRRTAATVVVAALALTAFSLRESTAPAAPVNAVAAAVPSSQPNVVPDVVPQVRQEIVPDVVDDAVPASPSAATPRVIDAGEITTRRDADRDDARIPLRPSQPVTTPRSRVPDAPPAPATLSRESLTPPAPGAVAAAVPRDNAPPPVTIAAAVPVVPPLAPTVRPADRIEPTGRVASIVPIDDTALVQQALQRYRIAYQELDAASAHAVWPAVDQAALARAFDGLASQALTFQNCDVQLAGDAATAACSGTTEYVPKLGSRERRVEPRRWNFSLRKRGAAWQIEDARARR
jgi:hypothetical protein